MGKRPEQAGPQSGFLVVGGWEGEETGVTADGDGASFQEWKILEQ